MSISVAQTAGFKIIGYYFQSKLHDAIQRNNSRTAYRQIPEKGVYSTYTKLELPTFEEGFDELYYVTIAEKGEFIVEKWQDEV